MRLNLGNETELYMLAAALQCHLTDLYVAVANVGDKLEDVTRYLAKTRQSHGREMSTVAAA